MGLLQLYKNPNKIISSHLPRDIRQTLLSEFDTLSAYRFHKKLLPDNKSVYTEPRIAGRSVYTEESSTKWSRVKLGGARGNRTLVPTMRK